ncbi:MAG: hypothetical protein IJF73_04785 [Clostridia bacterium]|nr:hypothetical protein [Clostridia bacterium]
MRVYPILPQPFGEDAVPKEVRFIVATARARGERVFCVDSRECSAYLRVATRHALSALKREGRVDFIVPLELLRSEDARAVLLREREPTVTEEPPAAVTEECDGITFVSL